MSAIDAMSAVDDELIVLVDENGTPTGTAAKRTSHHADTPLHLAFSCYVFDADGAFLVTRRAPSKAVWPGVWSNTVCGHPGPGESFPDAIRRRLDYELGMAASDIELAVADHRYRAPAFRGVVEHEFCPVYVARAAGLPRPNPAEVADCAWMDWEAFVDSALQDRADDWSWWCKNQLLALRDSALVGRYARRA
jgi:isopentenyl-diphosphate delta-isomerase